jgi:hypothetical protein
MYNDRVLVMYLPEAIGYMNSLHNKIKLPLAEKLPPLKHKIPLSAIISCTQSGKFVTLKYKDGNQ